MSLTNKIILIILCIIATMITRFLPFLLFPEGKKTPKFIHILSDRLPYAVMGMLIIYCLKDTQVFVVNSIVPTIIAVLGIVLLHVWKRNTLLSISIGTFLYMLFIRIL